MAIRKAAESVKEVAIALEASPIEMSAPTASDGLSLEQTVYAAALGALLSRGTPIDEAIALARDYAKQAAEAF